MLDAIEERLAQGHGSPGLASVPAPGRRQHLVVRNDLDRAADVPDPVLVHQALGDSPGLDRVASFGPDVGGEAHLDRGRHPDRSSTAAGRPSTPPSRSTRSPALGRRRREQPARSGRGRRSRGPARPDRPRLLGTEPTVLGCRRRRAPTVAPGGRRASSPTACARRERHFGALHDGHSATLTPATARAAQPAPATTCPTTRDAGQTTALRRRGRSVTASSSSAPTRPAGSSRGGCRTPPSTASPLPRGSPTPPGRVDAWWRVDLDAPTASGRCR